MPTEKKIQQVEELKEKLSKCTIAVATNPTGLKGAAITELRRRLRERDVEYTMVKNTLTYIAADGTEKRGLKEVVQGPTILALGYNDPTTVAKALDEFIKSTRASLAVTGALMGDRVLSAQDVETLAALPGREVLISRLLGQIQAPISRLVSVLNGPLAGLAIVLQQRAKQLEGQESS